MSISTSVLSDLVHNLPHLRPQLYFKASLTALSHAMEDQVLAVTLEEPLVIASFQRERFYRQESHRYLRLSQRSNQIYVLAAPETDFASGSDLYEKVAFEPDDALSQEWHLVVIAQNYATCLICREFPLSIAKKEQLRELTPSLDMDPSRRFEGVWTSERGVSLQAADLLLERILVYRPELASKINQARSRYAIGKYSDGIDNTLHEAEYACDIDTDPFVQRLVTYLQASQYKLHKAYRSITAQARKERLVNSITTAIRRSLNPQSVLQVAVQELGQHLGSCRCLIYRALATDTQTIIEHESLGNGAASVLGEKWQLENPLFQEVVQLLEGVCVADTMNDSRVTTSPVLWKHVEKLGIRSWLLEPVLYQGRLLGMIELHYCGNSPHVWQAFEIDLVKAIATQIGAALIQAESFANLEVLNQQLEALDRTRSNLIAITGHELRTPLSTIQVCLESLASEPDMPLEVRQIMLETALSDSERMRKLVQDFLTLSNLESGRVEWHPETLTLQECIDLSLSRIRTRVNIDDLPEIVTQIPKNLPLIRADGDWLVEVLAKLLDNASKFTPPEGKIIVKARNKNQMVEVIVADNGRGIEPNRLEIVFDRFYQEEGALRRTTGGTGLGLAICRQIVNGWDGEIWASSTGKNKGSQFHFTVPIAG